MMTMAEQVASRFTDGQTYTTAAGESLDTVARAAGAGAAVWADGPSGTLTRYEFDDGSTIVDSGEGWDLGFGLGCWCWQTNGHDDDCPSR